ncbi:non-canonical purine NTP pyrophosphatase, RdgB/HAM1 family [Candidatus Woesearchaeota archaeon]|nr:non-canonical purine NTP pyrophosphatase, RdgB/HAM1 family [Candidatus Woesearchaeota archaeon]
MTLTFVTSNMNKLREAEAILQQTLENTALDLPEIQGTPEEVTKAKAAYAFNILKKPCFVEDTSLIFNALSTLPGPYIKDFEHALSLAELPRIIDSFPDKTAQAICCIGYASPEKEPVVIKAVVPGTIVNPRGTTNFGWDPIFQPDGYTKTFAEMTPEEKNTISHRTQAFRKFKEYLER